MAPGDPASRRVTLREERGPGDYRFLEAYLDAAGNLHIDGQDIGEATKIVSPDGEYEWFKVIAAADVARLRKLLGIGLFQDLLTTLERRYSGEGSYELEARLRKAPFEVRLSVW